MDQVTLLSSLLLLPIIGAVLAAVVPSKFAAYIAAGVSLVVLALSVVMGIQAWGSPGEQEFSLFMNLPWSDISGMDISFSLGVDGISLFLVLLTALLFPVVLIYEWGTEKQQPKLYYVMLLLLEVGLIGFYLSLDMLLFYVFFELVLIPTSFFIGIWGGEKREKAAIQFFVYTLAGSLLMLVAILYLGLHVPGEAFTSNYFKIREASAFGAYSLDAMRWLFLGFAISFAIKTPLFPFHSWQPLAYSQSSTTGSVLLAAVMSKMGVYGFIRFCLPFFPDAVMQFGPVLGVLAVISVVYGAYQAVIQTDIKRLIAYASLSHLGFIVLGIFSSSSLAISGAVFQMAAHGVSTAAMFLLADVLYRRNGSYEISAYQGMARQMPVFSFYFMIAVLATVGLPGLSGFVGEFYILTGSFSSPLLSGAYAIVAALSLILAAVYLLNMFRKVMFGEEVAGSTKADMSTSEWAALLPLTILMVWMGLQATPFLKRISLDTANTAPVEVSVAPEPASPAETGSLSVNP